MNLTNRRTFERPDEGRRRALRLLALGPFFAGRVGAYAEELVRTPRMTEGPFFPDRLPLDTDNDLLVITDAVEPADGEITWLSGRILDATGSPIREPSSGRKSASTLASCFSSRMDLRMPSRSFCGWPFTKHCVVSSRSPPRLTLTWI